MAVTKPELVYGPLMGTARNWEDPPIRTVGTPRNAIFASHQMRQQLEPLNSITMLMHVSWPHHRHIIGKAGKTTQTVSQHAGVIIHFPDCNKNNKLTKSNIVAINSSGGKLHGLEEARASIRLLTPLIFSFKLNATAASVTISESNALAQNVQELYDVKVELRVTVDREPMIVGSVCGSEINVSRVKEATFTLLRRLCGPMANHLKVQMKMEISQQVQSRVFGRHETLRRIMQATNTTIRMPHAADLWLSPIEHSTVTISGAIDNVYAARQKIIGSLPIMLKFEVSSDSFNWKAADLIMQYSNVVIIPMPASLDGRLSASIHGAENNAAHIYEAWKLVTRSDKKLPSVLIPRSYNIAQVPLPSLLITLASNPAGFFVAPEGDLLRTSSSTQYDPSPSSSDWLNNNYIGHINNFSGITSVGLHAMPANDYRSDVYCIRQHHTNLPQQVQQEAAPAWDDEFRTFMQDLAMPLMSPARALSAAVAERVLEPIPACSMRHRSEAVGVSSVSAATLLSNMAATSLNNVASRFASSGFRRMTYDSSSASNSPVCDLSAVSATDLKDSGSYENLIGDSQLIDNVEHANYGAIGDGRPNKPLESIVAEQ